MSDALRLKARDVPTKLDRLQPGEEAWPRLSETLKGPKHPEFCQKCGRSHLDIDALGGSLQAWQECGQDGKRDLKENIFVMICSLCNKHERGIVARHPRFYHDLPRNAPILGIMDLCVECAWRDGTHCVNRSEKRIEYSQPITAHIRCSPRSRSGMYSYYPSGPRSCSGREQIEVTTDVENSPLGTTHRFAHDLEEASLGQPIGTAGTAKQRTFLPSSGLRPFYSAISCGGVCVVRGNSSKTNRLVCASGEAMCMPVSKPKRPPLPRFEAASENRRGLTRAGGGLTEAT